MICVQIYCALISLHYSSSKGISVLKSSSLLQRPIVKQNCAPIFYHLILDRCMCIRGAQVLTQGMARFVCSNFIPRQFCEVPPAQKPLDQIVVHDKCPMTRLVSCSRHICFDVGVIWKPSETIIMARTECDFMVGTYVNKPLVILPHVTRTTEYQTHFRCSTSPKLVIGCNQVALYRCHARITMDTAMWTAESADLAGTTPK